MKVLIKVALVFLLCTTSGRLYADTPALGDLPLQSSITKDGITWDLSEPVRVGRFVTGDYYVVGAVTITAITPAPAGGRDGSVLNLPVDQGISGFDDRVDGGRFRENLRSYPPISLSPGDALISSISVEVTGLRERWLREGNEQLVSPVKTVSVLTCLSEPAAYDAFRPSYCDRTQKLFYADSLQRGMLPTLARVAGTPTINEFAWHYSRPWLEVCFFGFDAATEYQPDYGREVGRAGSMAGLLLMCDFTPAEKESLLIGFVQYGVDLWGIARAGYSGWQAHGGHGNGRKWPIVFAGIMLGDDQMAAPTQTMPNLRFGEDMQTMYDNGWTGANVVYAGHTGVWNGQPVSSDPTWQPYEHLHPSQWPGNLGENYRRCCTSVCWIGQALGAMLLGAMDEWDHPAFFDYADRWMTEDDTEDIATILSARGWNYSASYNRQGQCWDGFVQNMWAAYRPTVGISDFPLNSGVLAGKGLAFSIGPNPFSLQTTISLNRESYTAPVLIRVYDSEGKYVRTIQLETGQAPGAVWNGTDDSGRQLEPGIYYIHHQDYIQKAILLQ